MIENLHIWDEMLGIYPYVYDSSNKKKTTKNGKVIIFMEEREREQN